MTPAEAIASVRASSRHDEDQAVTDDQISIELDQAYRRLRRRLAGFVPSLYQATSAPVIASGQTTFTKPSDFEALILLERFASGSVYYPVGILSPSAFNAPSNPDQLSAYEQGSVFVVRPDAYAPGTYRLTYATKPATGYTSYDLPEGFEACMTEAVAAWVRARHDEDPSWHEKRAAQIWGEQIQVLRRRYGRHPIGGLAITR